MAEALTEKFFWREIWSSAAHAAKFNPKDLIFFEKHV
jgi:hypothetical protein